MGIRPSTCPTAGARVIPLPLEDDAWSTFVKMNLVHAAFFPDNRGHGDYYKKAQDVVGWIKSINYRRP